MTSDLLLSPEKRKSERKKETSDDKRKSNKDNRKRDRRQNSDISSSAGYTDGPSSGIPQSKIKIKSSMLLVYFINC